MSYDLNDNVADSFEFILGGFTYKMRYPTVEEAEAVQALLTEAGKDVEGQKKATEEMYKFISSENPEAPPITELMRKQTVKVMQKFSEMIKAEFGNE